jgi:hypothetical protein
METYINGLNKNALEKTIAAMKADTTLGRDIPVRIDAVWEEGKVTGVDGKLVCYPPPEIQLGKVTLGPSTNSFCPMVSSGCFCLVMMLKAAEEGLRFQEVTSNTTAEANLIGFFKEGWKGDEKNGRLCKHPWTKGLNLGVVIRSEKSQSELSSLADHGNKHCPSSEVMKREFPVEVEFRGNNKSDAEEIDWEKVPVYYNMERYKDISEMDSFPVKQEANMIWHCQNENKLHPSALMTFTFPEDSNSSLVLGFDPPIGRPNQYANPVQACFFGGLSTLLHTVACRIYVHGYKVAKIKGTVKTAMNKRKVLGADKTGYVFIEGASIEVLVTSNAPREILAKAQREAEEMSPTMMNWREELPFMYGVARLPPRDNDGTSVISEVSTESRTGRRVACTRGGPRKRLLNFLWKLSHKKGCETY